MHFHPMTAAGILAVAFAVLMPFQRSLYASALCLMGALLQVGVVYFLLGVGLLGWMQVLIYAGAVMVLIVIAVMVASGDLQRRWAPIRSPWVAAAGMGVLLLALAGLRRLGPVAAPAGASAALEREMASVLFGRFALITESVGFIILLASLAVFISPAARSPR